MKTRYIVLYAFFFLLMSAGLLLNLLCREKDTTLPVYTIEINRLLIAVGEDWDGVSQRNGDITESDEPFDYAVIDREGKLLFATKEGISTTISAATGHFDIIRDIEAEGETVGRLIVYNSSEEAKLAENRRNAAMTGVMLLLMLAVSVGYFLYLKKRVVEPFNSLEGFAEKIAAGDLDTPLEMDRENIFGAFTESFDIMREELKASRLREEAAVKSRKEMIAELSHDIKTPVASIKAMTEFLQLTTDDEGQRETLSSINSKADRIDKLISNMFHATLEELEQLEVHPEEIASAELEGMIRESDHLKKLVSTDIKECVIVADRMRLEQIVGNIISNSYKYADTDMTVESFFEGKSLVVGLSDSGGGVPDEELELITEKFRRGSNSEGKDGSGIGLYISKYLMERVGGELICRNNGEGFTVELRFELA